MDSALSDRPDSSKPHAFLNWRTNAHSSEVAIETPPKSWGKCGALPGLQDRSWKTLAATDRFHLAATSLSRTFAWRERPLIQGNHDQAINASEVAVAATQFV